MGHRLFTLGLVLNAIALGGLVLLGVGMFALALASANTKIGWTVLTGCWTLFTLGTLFLAMDSPPGTRVKAAALFGLSALSDVLLFGGRGVVEFGPVFGVISLLFYCSYQDTLACWLDDAELKTMIKRAYDWPLKIFLLGLLAIFLGVITRTGQTLAMPIVVIAFIGCPIWGFAYLSVVTLNLVKAFRGQNEEKASVRPRTEF